MTKTFVPATGPSEATVTAWRAAAAARKARTQVAAATVQMGVRADYEAVA